MIIEFKPSKLGQKLNPPFPIIPEFLIKSLSKLFPIPIEKIENSELYFSINSNVSFLFSISPSVNKNIFFGSFISLYILLFS